MILLDNSENCQQKLTSHLNLRLYKLEKDSKIVLSLRPTLPRNTLPIRIYPIFNIVRLIMKLALKPKESKEDATAIILDPVQLINSGN